MQKTILMKVSTKHLADERKLLEFQRGRIRSIDFSKSVEFVFQYPEEAITFFYKPTKLWKDEYMNYC